MHTQARDLYFVGIKNGLIEDNPIKLPKYEKEHVMNTSLHIYDLEDTNQKLQVNPSYQLENINTIYNKYNTDKNSFYHNYTRQYERLLNDFRCRPIKYLEIGVLSGESLLAFKETFKYSTSIVGLDINDKYKQFENKKNNIFVEIGDATNLDFIKSIVKKYGTFDIILDDGSHKNTDVINTFELLFPLLNDNGLYIVEDTICYKSQRHIDNNHPNHLEYFFNYTKFLNQWRYDSTEGIHDNLIDPFKIKKKTNDLFEYSIDKIEFGCSYIAISKKIRKHWKC
jgi:cephalosporin hydroxylase